MVSIFAHVQIGSATLSGILNRNRVLVQQSKMAAAPRRGSGHSGSSVERIFFVTSKQTESVESRNLKWVKRHPKSAKHRVCFRSARHGRASVSAKVVVDVNFLETFVGSLKGLKVVVAILERGRQLYSTGEECSKLPPGISYRRLLCLRG
jgi:hypothetical protein